jgi:peroxiredoxin
MLELSSPIRAITRSVRTPWMALGGLILFALASDRGWSTRSDGSAAKQVIQVKTDQKSERTIHYVTPRQVLDANAMVRSAVNDVSAVDQGGTRRDWAALGGGQPVVLVFARKGCPCNAQFEPFFQRVERLYQGKVRFAAVIDADVEEARSYQAELNVPYPVLADPDRELIRRFKVENGGYVVLLANDATIDGAWPGCSADGLRELGRRIARLSGVDERPVDTRDMPRALITGCPFL